MRTVFVMLLIFFIFGLAFLNGAYLTNVPQELIQPDGTVYNCFATGDEFNRWAHDANGYTIVRNTVTGYYVYAIPDGNGMKPSEYVVGRANPESLALTKNLRENPDIVNQRTAEFNRELQNKSSRTPTYGTIQNIVVFVRFQDQTAFPASYSFNTMNTRLNGTGLNDISMRRYFEYDSANQLTVNSNFYPSPSGDLVTCYAVLRNRNYYMKYDEVSNPDGYDGQGEANDRERAMLGSIVDYLDDNSVVSSGLDIDGDDDGVVDNITFIFRGPSDGVWGSILWAHRFWLEDDDRQINGKVVRDYNFLLESNQDTGVFCHEFSHSLGFPDLYHYPDHNNGIDPVGSWDPMKRQENPTQRHLNYMCYKYGHWTADPPLISTPGTYTLTSRANSPWNAYKFATGNPNEFIYVEYRQRTGQWETSLPENGLIFYRVIPSINGNSNGHPDEVYVYRAGGTTTVDGNVYNAAFSADKGNTAFHQYTYPSPFLSNGANSGLIITDISETGGNTMSFTLRSSIPKTWTGDAGNGNWNTSQNWANGIPGPADDVVIPGGLYDYPNTNAGGGACANITLERNALIIVGDAPLTVNGNLNCYGHIEFRGYGTLNVTGDLVAEATSQINADTSLNPSASITIGGSMINKTGCNVDLQTGSIEFYGASTGYLSIYQEITLPTLIVSKTTPGSLQLPVGNSESVIIKGDLNINSGANFHVWSNLNVILYGNYTCHALGHGYLYSGNLICMGNDSSLNIGNYTANFLHHLNVNKETGASLYLQNGVMIEGNLDISSGIFNPQSWDVQVRGNWNNTQTAANFAEGTGKVIFCGGMDQSVNNETFYQIENQKSGGRIVINTGQTVSCVSYDWTQGGITVNGGSFSAGDLVDEGIYGAYTLNGGTINLTQGVSEWVDLRADVVIHGGVFNVYGGASPAYLPYGNDASLTMDSGVFDFHNVGLYLPNSPVLTENITGGLLRTTLDFVCDRADFHPEGGTLELYGTTDCTLQMVAGSLNSLLIRKGNTTKTQINQPITARNGAHINATRNMSANVYGTLQLNGNFVLQNGTFYAPELMKVKGDWINTAGADYFVEGTYTVELNGTAHQYCDNTESFNKLVLNKASGAFRVNSPGAVITCAEYEFYAGAIDLLQGTFTANDLLQDGIYGNFYVNSGCRVNLYQDTSSYIDLNANLYIFGGEFHVYGGSSSSYITYSGNASITMNAGVIDFHNHGMYLSPSAFTFAEAITGGTIRTIGEFCMWRDNFHPEGGLVEMYGSGTTYVSLFPGSRLYSLMINKTAASKQDTQLAVIGTRSGNEAEHIQRIPTRDEGIYFATAINMSGNLLVQAGTLDINSNTVDVLGNGIIIGKLRMINEDPIDQLSVHGSFVWAGTAIAEVTTGAFRFYGDYTVQAGANIVLPATCYTRFMSVNGSTILLNGNNCSFGYLGFEAVAGGRTNSISPSSTDTLRVSTNLLIDTGNTLYLNGRPTRVGNFVSVGATGQLALGASGNMQCTGSLYQYGTLNIGNGMMSVGGEYINNTGSSLQIAGGTFRIDGFDITPSFSINGNVTMASGIIQFTSMGMTLNNDAKNITGGILRSYGSFSARSSEAIRQTSGGVMITGIGIAHIYCDNGNHIGSLTINKEIGSTLYQQTDLDIRGAVSISSGNLNAQGYNTSLTGSFINTAGALCYEPGTGTVTFNGSTDEQFITGQVRFNNVIAATNSANFVTFSNPVTILGYLRVNNLARTASDMSIQGTLEMNVAWAQFHCLEGANITAQYYDGGGTLMVSGGFMQATDLVDNGFYGNYFISGGYLYLSQDAEHSIDISGGIYMSGGEFHIYGGAANSYLSYSGNTTLNMTNGILDFADKGITIYASGSYTFNSTITGGTIKCNGSFLNNRSNFIPTGGTVEFCGASSANIIQTGASRFWNITVNKASSSILSASSDLTIGGNVLLSGGSLLVGTATLYVGGNWENTIGTAAFSEGTGTVVFNGANQDILSNETFYNLSLANTGIHFDDFEQATGTTVNVFHNLNLVDGTWEMNAAATLIINGDLTISTGAGLNSMGDGGLNISLGGNLTDYNTTIDSWNGYFTDNSTLTFNGNENQIITVASTNLTVGNLIINKPPLSAVRTNRSIVALQNVHMVSGYWWDSFMGLSHYVTGDFSVDSNATFDGSTANTISFIGSGDNTLSYNSTTGFFYNFTINKTSSRSEGTRSSKQSGESGFNSLQNTRGQSLSLASNLKLLNSGALLVQAGTFNLNHNTLTCFASLSVDSGATLVADSGSVIQMGSNQSVSVNNGGRMNLLGSSEQPVLFTHMDNYYQFSVESGGILAAANAIFEYMDANGVTLNPGSTLDSDYAFTSCTFRYGASGGTLLSVNNNQAINISGAVFPANTWEGAYNVSKTLDSGSVSFLSASGDFAGPSFENDSYNRIAWSGFNPNLRVLSIIPSKEDPYVGEAISYRVTVINDSDTNVTRSFGVHLFYTRTTPPTEGDFGNLTHDFASLAAGDTVSYLFTGVTGSSAEGWNSYASVDPESVVTESNELDNASAACPITWQDLVPIDDLSILYNPVSNEIELTWTYPYPVSYFRIYYSTVPDSGFTSYADSEFPFCNIPAGDNKYFYRVTAVIE